MPQITDLNIAPYYDDFDKEDNFHRVLFRPGFAIQARELTQLQSIMQNQVERFGRHMFQEGTVVIPGQVTYSNNVTNVQHSSCVSRNSDNIPRKFQRKTMISYDFISILQISTKMIITKVRRNKPLLCYGTSLQRKTRPINIDVVSFRD